MEKKATLPKVSVSVVTYNHERYIEQCLKSILEQRTSFAFEIVIGDDASTDATRKVIQHFYELYPDIIRPVFHDVNIGARKNYLSVVQNCQGEYIAHIDGDDWMLQGKLQAQSDFLDKYKDCAFVCHSLKVYDEDAGAFSDVLGPSKNIGNIISIQTLIEKGCFFGHSSKMYRVSSIPPAGFETHEDMRALDFLFHIQNAIYGNIGCIHEVYGVYRKHEHGVSNASNYDMHLKGYLRAIEYAREKGIEPAVVNKGYVRVCFMFLKLALLRDDFELFKKCRNLLKKQSVNFGFRWVLFFMNWKVLRAVYLIYLKIKSITTFNPSVTE